MVIYAGRETVILAGILLMAAGIGTWRFGKGRSVGCPRSPTSSLVIEWAGMLTAAAGALLVATAVFAWAMP